MKQAITAFFFVIGILNFLGMPAVILAAEVTQPAQKLKQTPLEHFLLLSEFEINQQDLLETRRHLLNVRREVGKDLGYYPKFRYKVILSTQETFRKYTALPSHVTGFFDGRIHIPLPSVAKSDVLLKSILWHEYTHALVYELTQGRCPVWLNEGLAVYEEAKILPQPLRLLAEFVKKEDRLPYRMNELNTLLEDVRGRDAIATKRVYEQAFCLVDYLFSRYSRANIHDLLVSLEKGLSIEEALKKVFYLDSDDVETRWLSHTKKLIGA